MHSNIDNILLTVFAVFGIEALHVSDVELFVKLSCQIAIAIATIHTMWKNEKRKS